MSRTPRLRYAPLLLALVAGVACAAVAPVAAQSRRRSDVRLADLSRDPRLARRITLHGEVLPLHQAVSVIAQVADVEILVQGELFRRPVALRVKNRTCAEVMEDLALLFGGAWVRRENRPEDDGDAYLLLTDEVTARMVAAHRASVGTDRQERALWASLDPRQWETLRQHRFIPFEALRPEQKQLVLAIARDRWLANPERYPSSILMGKDLRISLSPTVVVVGFGEPNQHSFTCHTLMLMAPTIQDDGTLSLEWLAEYRVP